MKAPPNQTPVQDTKGIIAKGWQEFYSMVYSVLAANQQSGTTAQRPIKGLWVGRRYFDTSLGIPVYYDGADWIDAAGNVV